jgi:hypothetical protein
MKKRIENICNIIILTGIFTCPISWCFIESTNPAILHIIAIVNIVSAVGFVGKYFLQNFEKTIDK